MEHRLAYGQRAEGEIERAPTQRQQVPYAQIFLAAIRRQRPDRTRAALDEVRVPAAEMAARLLE